MVPETCAPREMMSEVQLQFAVDLAVDLDEAFGR
jgi:hypothetical protein